MNQITRRQLLLASAGIPALNAMKMAPLQIARVGAHHLKLGLCAYSYRDYLTGKSMPKMNLLEFLDHAAKMPLDGVELTEYYFPRPLNDEFVLELKRKCYLFGLGISGAPMATTLTYPAGAKRDAEILKIKNWLLTAELLGAPTVRIFAGAPQQGQSQVEARKNAIEAIEQACDIAAKHGIILVLENHHGITDNAEQLLEIVKGVKSEWFGLNLDFGNFYTSDPYSDLIRCAPFAITTHFKTEMKPRNGPKIPTDLKRAINILKDCGYRGYVNLEYEATEEPIVAVPRIISQLHNLI